MNEDERKDLLQYLAVQSLRVDEMVENAISLAEVSKSYEAWQYVAACALIRKHLTILI